MTRKLFIVACGNDHLFTTLSSALRNESDVEIIFDRRKPTGRNAATVPSAAAVGM